MVNGTAIANDTRAAAPPTMRPKIGMTDAIVESGARKRANPKNMSSVPTPRRIQVSNASALRWPSINSAAERLPTAASST